ncbi:uncharacterized protein K452DRAFT_292330 [Aplosporella prunicola CBS 121167]|uniref:AA1-like domain-containing protein n=1 Tax=Aplosporella prunicola CBS 121167 TaxID=1176127 RepID=A0A6A6AWW4_9PEZI|nr:uncharacterized protein K452DRAFT_292330 [Aplosporella prunicola CBS 121167]KAF2136482.1 hypothetical protein K452DRAFT_292330 [Aplosporella prunicola CBS 121167]
MLFLTTVLSTLALLSGSVLSAEFQLDSIYSSRRQSNNLHFDIWEDNPLSNETARCESSWNVQKLNWPTEYIACGESTSWNWYVTNWTVYNFTLELRHSFSDPSTQTFHQRFARFVEPHYSTCKYVGQGVTNCNFPSGAAEVYDEKITPLE